MWRTVATVTNGWEWQMSVKMTEPFPKGAPCAAVDSRCAKSDLIAECTRSAASVIVTYPIDPLPR